MHLRMWGDATRSGEIGDTQDLGSCALWRGVQSPPRAHTFIHWARRHGFRGGGSSSCLARVGVSPPGWVLNRYPREISIRDGREDPPCSISLMHVGCWRILMRCCEPPTGSSGLSRRAVLRFGALLGTLVWRFLRVLVSLLLVRRLVLAVSASSADARRVFSFCAGCGAVGFGSALFPCGECVSGDGAGLQTLLVANHYTGDPEGSGFVV